MRALLISLMIFWMAATLLPLLLHGTALLRKITGLDRLGLIPRWKMFVRGSPGLSQYDYYICYRDRLADGSYTAWQLLEPPNAKWTRFVWNPALTRQMAVYQYAFFLLCELKNWQSPAEATVEVYGQLVSAVLRKPRLSVRSRQRQFSLVRRDMAVEGEYAPETLESILYDL